MIEDLLRELIAEVRTLRRELAAREPEPVVPDTGNVPVPSPYQPYRYGFGGCDACRLSGACNCVNPPGAPVVTYAANAQPIYTWVDPNATGCAPGPGTFTVLNTGAANPLPFAAGPSGGPMVTGGCAPIGPITIHTFRTGASEP